MSDDSGVARGTASPYLDLLRERVVVFDGAAGTYLQQVGLTADDFGSDALEGCTDLLSVTRPDVIAQMHADYFEAGADVVETNSFGGTTIAMADYRMEHLVDELNVAAAQVARRAADRAEAEDGRPRWVAGSMGPTTRTASLSPDVNDPGFRAVTFDELVSAFRQQAQATPAAASRRRRARS